MARPKQGYHLEDGTRVPSVTTVTGRFKESGGMTHAAWKLGAEGKDYRDEWFNLATVGHAAHELIEARVHGVEPQLPDGTTPEVAGKALQALEAFDVWAKGTELEVLETEVSLVSEFHRYGGTLDLIARCRGELTIVDYKTGTRVYPDHIVQASAYADLWSECRGPEKVFSADVIRISRDTADFAHHHFGAESLDLGFQYFLALRGAYDLAARLKRLV